jgi:hypothetical protein
LHSGSAPLTLVSLGSWTSITAAAGEPARGYRVFSLAPSQAASRRAASRAPFQYTVTLARRPPDPCVVRRRNAMPSRDENIAKLCPELRAILEAELAAGNSIAETWDGWGLGVLLSRPFLVVHPVGGSVCFRPLNDPHYWKAEYACDTLKQIVGCRF